MAMIGSYDVGSIPPRIESDVIWSGAKASQTLMPLLLKEAKDDPFRVFEQEIVSSFVDKLKAGIDAPNYPQLRDMNEMFIDLLQGLEKTPAGYLSLGRITAKPGASIPEVDVLRRNASSIADSAGLERFAAKMCVTGPYTLASFFRNRDAKLIEDLGSAIADIAARSFFRSRKGEVTLIFIDEPVMGFTNDPLLDYGSEGRGSLRRSWQTICRVASVNGIESGIHLHDTSDNLFWDVDGLTVVESHVDDPLYVSEAAVKRLEQTGKKLKASICITAFDRLIEGKVDEPEHGVNVQQRVGEEWSKIRRGLVDPTGFLELPDLMLRRLKRIVKRFGAEHVRYAGPECGLWSFPNHECALECLKRVSRAVYDYNTAS